MARVRVGGPLRQLADGRATHNIPGATVLELVAGFERANPAAEGWILDERGRIRRHINVFVNGEAGRGEDIVGPNDEVDILPSITGGSRGE